MTDFGFTKDHELLRQSTRRLLSERCPRDVVRKLDEDDRGFDPALYAEIADLGWVGLALPEDAGGAELDYLSLALVFEEMGRALLPSPFFGSVLAASAIVDSGANRNDLCEAIASGKTIATIGFTEPNASWEPDDIDATAEATDGGFALTGVKTHVTWGADASLLVAPFCVGDEVGLFAVDLAGPGITVEPEVCVDRTRRTARVTLDGAAVPATARLGGDATEAWRTTLRKGAAMLAAEMVGGAQTVLNVTRDYAIERIQFGRPIGSFQAVKHPIVNVMLAVEAARSHAYAAAAALDEDPSTADTAVRMAKASAEQAYSFACDRGVQLHGGYGFTYDCDVHFYFKRALWSAATLGDARHHRRHLADALF